MFIGLAVSFSASGARFQSVYSIKNLGEQQDADGNVYERVQVRCNTGPGLRYLHRDASTEGWCVNGTTTECFKERLDAATRACRADKSSIIAPATAKQPSAEKIRKQAERDALERELAINQQKKIELRTRRLELRKRELELQAQLDNT